MTDNTEACLKADAPIKCTVFSCEKIYDSQMDI